MHKKYKILAIFSIIITLLSPQLKVIAQEFNSENEFTPEIQGLDPAGVREGEITNCFDTYKFGPEGIVLTAGTEANEYKPYDLVEVSGQVLNNNPYPIIDMTVRARILRTHPNPVEQRALYITVDDVVVAEDITINANSQYDLNYVYNVSGNAPAGDYIIQYYVYNQDRFNLSGLSFTEDIISNLTEFKVLGGAEHVYLDKTNITLDDKINDTRAFITNHESDKNIPIRLPLINPTNISKEIEVTYKLYKWDEILENNFIDEKIQSIKIAPNVKIDLEYIVDTSNYPVYYVIIEAIPVGEEESSLATEKTMAHIRFKVEDNNRPRINWIGLDKSPFNTSDVNMVVCAHNTVSTTDEGPVKVKSIARDEKGRELSKIEYEGIMPSVISGIKNKLNTDKRFNLVSIETNLYNANNELIDNIITNYDCNEISPELCLLESNNIFNIKNIMIIISLGLLSILGVGIYYKRYIKSKN